MKLFLILLKVLLLFLLIPEGAFALKNVFQIQVFYIINIKSRQESNNLSAHGLAKKQLK
jgi:hypothetical protein